MSEIEKEPRKREGGKADFLPLPRVALTTEAKGPLLYSITWNWSTMGLSSLPFTLLLTLRPQANHFPILRLNLLLYKAERLAPVAAMIVCHGLQAQPSVLGSLHTFPQLLEFPL